MSSWARALMVVTTVVAGMPSSAGAAGSERERAYLSAHREPYLALRMGLKCSACHTNATGGGNRTAFGSLFAQTALPMRTGAVLNKSLSNFLSIGWDLRVRASGTFRASEPRTSVGIDEAQLYLAAELLNRRLVLYIDETVGPQRAVAREMFAMIRGLPGSGYAKAGKLLLPFGLRLEDDAEFIRERTGFTFFTPDQGVELGFEPGPLAFAVALSNGSAGAAENNSGKQITSRGALVFRRARVGGSVSRNYVTGGVRDVVGGFGGVLLGPVGLLGEIDLIRNAPNGAPNIRQLAAFAEADWLITRGVNLKATYGYLDPNTAIAENQRVRARLGLEVFPVQFLRLAAFYLFQENIPQATDDLDRLSLEAHLHF